MDESDRDALGRINADSRALIASSKEHLNQARAVVERGRAHVDTTTKWLRRHGASAALRAARVRACLDRE